MPWSTIVERYLSHRGERHAEQFERALTAVEELAREIATGPLSAALFGWTSMFDLCIQQTDASPGAGPYLRVSPSPSGHVEFRYFDTMVPQRQWHREVPPDAVLPRLTAFMDQLHWLG